MRPFTTWFSTLTALSLFSLHSPQAEDPLALAILPLTGNAADRGEWAKRGLELAHDELKRDGLSTFTIRYEDSQGGDPATTVQAYKSAPAQRKPVEVFTYGSGAGMALTPLVNAERVVQIGVATGTPKYRSQGDFTFRIWPSATLEGDVLAQILLEK
jgi:ABC-type branched-subunit amino acid transport system substrate-binding protein